MSPLTVPISRSSKPNDAGTVEARHGNPSVLIVAWEFPGFHSRQGTALSRRIGHIARGFARGHWHVSVLHPAQRPNDPAVDTEVMERMGTDTIVTRRAVGRAGVTPRLQQWWQTPFRKLSTLWHALRYGDRSGRWALEVEKLAKSGVLAPPTLVVGCFTPRGPLGAAHRLHRLWGVPWIADLQDPWREGTAGILRRIVALWMRRTLRSAAMVVQVSPEWAEEDAVVLRRNVDVLRHAVPDLKPEVGNAPTRQTADSCTILYAGSLDQDSQDMNPFMDALKELAERRDTERRFTVKIAGSNAVWEKFVEAASARGIAELFEWLGWLSDSDLRKVAAAADALLLIPWFPRERQGVPSKLYEYVAFATPTLIAGPDSGGISRLLEEWGHPPVVAGRAGDIAQALGLAERGDASLLFDRARCRIAPLTENELGAWYVARAASLAHACAPSDRQTP